MGLFKRVFIIICFLFFSQNVFSNETAEELKNPKFVNISNLKYSSSDEILTDKFNQFLYSVMGRDSLLNSLPFETPDNIVDEVKDRLDSESNSFIFLKGIGNSDEASFSIIFIKIASYLGIFILVIFFLWNTVENLMSGQFSGSFLGSQFFTGKLAKRFVIVTLLVVPVNNMPLSYYIFLKGMGYSNIVAHKIHDYLVDSSVTITPSITFPNFDSKTSYGREILQFGVCLYENGISPEEAGSVVIPFTKSDGKYYTNTTINGCNLVLNFKLDEVMIDNFKNNEELSGIIKNPEEKQVSAILGAVSLSLNNAVNYGRKFVDSYNKMKGNYNSLVLESFEQSLGNNIDYSRDFCETINGYQVNKPSELYYFTNSAINCLSNDVVTSLSYPSDISYNELFFENPISPGKAEVCYSGDFNGDISYITGSGSLYTDTGSIREVDPLGCVQNKCNSSNELYQCSVAANLVSQNSLKNKNKENGWLYAGVSIYNAFSTAEVSESAKTPLNSLNAFSTKYQGIVFGDVIKNPSNYGEVPNGSISSVNISLSPLEVSNLDNFSSYEALGTINAITLTKYGSSDYLNKYLTEFATFGFNGGSGILGSKEFFECIKNPLSIKDGFYCGTTTDEMLKFGKNIYRFMVSYYTYHAIYSTARTITNKDGESSNQSGGISDGGSFGGKKSGVGASGINLPEIIGSGLSKVGLAGMTSYFVYFNNVGAENDAYLPQSTFGNTVVEASVIPVISYAVASETSLGKIISLFMNVLTFICFLTLIIIPLMPFALFFAAIINFFYRFFTSLVFLCAWVATMLSAKEASFSDMSARGVMMLLQLLMMPPLYITGLIVSWFLAGDLISSVISHGDVFATLAVDSSGFVKSIIDTVVGMLFYIIILYVIYTLIFSIIEGLHSMATEWIFGNLSLTAFGKNRASSWENYSGVGQIVAGKFSK